MKKRAVIQRSRDNSFGIAALIFGVLSIIFYSYNGIVLSIFGIIFALKQWHNRSNKWAIWALALSIIGLLIGLATVLNYVPSSPGIFKQLNSITP